MTLMTVPATISCTCGELLSPDGISWRRQGYRLGKRSDGTFTLSIVGRPEAKGGKMMCKPCARTAVTNARKAALQ